MSKLATAILYFNKPTMTERCLASVRRSLAAAGEDERVILVDNGSTTSLSFSGCESVRLSPNQGFARGMNAALKTAFAGPETRAAVLLSNDIELDPGFHRAALELELGRAAIFCPNVYYLVDKSKPAYTHGSVELATGQLAHHFDESQREIRFPLYYPAAATVWTREAFTASGGFNERYFCYWEDVELSHRASRLGIALIAVPRLRVHHLGRGTTGGKRIYTEHFRAGQELTFELLSIPTAPAYT